MAHRQDFNPDKNFSKLIIFQARKRIFDEPIRFWMATFARR